jgi:hypothetical protein
MVDAVESLCLIEAECITRYAPQLAIVLHVTYKVQVVENSSA